MSKLWSYLIFMAWLSYLLSSGVFLFIDGFFLNRIARMERSTCEPCTKHENCMVKNIFKSMDKSSNICLQPHARVVLLVVDALKYEFMEWQDADVGKTDYHVNKIPIVNKLLKKYPKSTRLYRFVADPPTTTMQRLKGIMTGTLPTFIDVGSNFATERINEDNIIDQAAQTGKVVFMGDDTWVSLFAGKFYRQFPSPSFNVWDLDTTDREVRNRITFELKKSDWTLLIAHTLGVDHCGHKHGKHHPEMARKLSEVNRLIQEIVEGINNDTILFVVGDHGMTESGDHGGDSTSEVEAAMFVHSKINLYNITMKNNKTINQIDIVPTLSSILGIPIPFSNIGTIVVDVLPNQGINQNDERPWFAAHSVWRNVEQTKKYIDVYTKDSFLFTDEKTAELKYLYNAIRDEASIVHNDLNFERFYDKSILYLRLVKELCTDIWVQFNAALMSKGLILVICTLFFFYILINGIPETRMNHIMDSYFLRFVVYANFAVSIVTYILYICGITEEYKNTNFFATGTVSMVLLVILIVQNWDCISTTWYKTAKRKKTNYLQRGILWLMICGLFSNSYIIEEDKVLSFLLVTTIGLLIYSAIDEEYFLDNYDKKIKFLKNHVNAKKLQSLLILIGFFACAATRISNNFWHCREEQDKKSCVTLIGKAGLLNHEETGRILLTGSLILLALYITIIRIWLRNCGNLSGFSISIIAARYCPGVIVVCIGCYWVLQRLPKDAQVKLAVSWQMNALPGIVYFFVLICILILYWKPLNIHILPRKKDTISIFQGEDVIPKLFDRVKEVFYTKKANDHSEVPVVYGLGTVYSATVILFSVFLTLLWALLLGSILAAGTFMMFVACAAVLGIVALERFRNAGNIGELLQTPSSAILCWFLIAEYFFYGTGHQSTFPTIQWDAAFIGTGGHFYGNFLPAILIGMNTFGCHLIVALTLPLLAIAPFTVYVMIPEIAKLKFRADEEMRKGELLLFERETTFHNALFSIYGKYILLHGIRTFACMLTATIHCRHLMVWKIFAPKLIFEGLSFLVSLGSILASAFMVLRIDHRVDDLISRIVTKTR